MKEKRIGALRQRLIRSFGGAPKIDYFIKTLSSDEKFKELVSDLPEIPDLLFEESLKRAKKEKKEPDLDSVLDNFHTFSFYIKHRAEKHKDLPLRDIVKQSLKLPLQPRGDMVGDMPDLLKFIFFTRPERHKNMDAFLESRFEKGSIVYMAEVGASGLETTSECQKKFEDNNKKLNITAVDLPGIVLPIYLNPPNNQIKVNLLNIYKKPVPPPNKIFKNKTAPDKYDIIRALHVFHYDEGDVQNRLRGIKNIRKTLKEGGYFCVDKKSIRRLARQKPEEFKKLFSGITDLRGYPTLVFQLKGNKFKLRKRIEREEGNLEYILENIEVDGDKLFKGSKGEVDRAASEFKAHLKSLQEKEQDSDTLKEALRKWVSEKKQTMWGKGCSARTVLYVALARKLGFNVQGSRVVIDAAGRRRIYSNREGDPSKQEVEGGGGHVCPIDEDYKYWETDSEEPLRHEDSIPLSDRQLAANLLDAYGYYNEIGRSDPEKGIQFYKKVLELDPRNERALITMANLYDRLGHALTGKQEKEHHYNRAEEYLRYLVKKNPKHALGWFDLGKLYRRRNKPKKAEEFFKKAGEINPVLKKETRRT